MLCRRDFREYGLTVKDWRPHLNLGLLGGMLLMAAACAVNAVRGPIGSAVHTYRLDVALVRMLLQSFMVLAAGYIPGAVR